MNWYEKEQEESADDTVEEVAKLLASKSVSLKLSEILPETLATPIEKLAATLNLKPEGYLLALLVQSGSLLKASTSTMLYPQSQFRCSPNYFGSIVAESSQKKTPIVRAIVNDPMEKLLVASEQEYQKASLAYEEDLNKWKNNKDTDKGAMPQPPAQKVFAFTKATGEGIASQAQKLPQQSMLYLCDELAGAFKSANQYRGGKGSDEEDLLEYWSGGGAVVLRVGGLATNVRHVGLSIFGSIQPKVLAGFIGDGDDNNGKFARFDFVQQPLSATKLVEDAPSINLTQMLTAIYERLDALPQQNFELDRAARKLFIRFYNYCETQRISHPKQGMRAMWGKAPLKVGKIATILHCLHAAHLGLEISPKITIETIRSAIKFIKFTTDQALSLNLEICESNELAPNLAKIVFLASRKGTVTVSEIRQGFNSKHRPSVHQVRDWFKQLSTMKYGEVVEVGKTISFMCPTCPTSASNPDTERVQGVQLRVELGAQLEAEVSNLPVSAALKEDHPPNVQESNLDTKLDIDTEVGHEIGHGVGQAKPLSDKDFGSKLDRLDTLDTALNEELAELVNFVRVAIAENNREFAQNIQSILKDVCGAGAVDRKQVWNALTPEEQTALTALLKPYTETEEIVITSEPEIQPEIASEVEPEKTLITALDAETIRDIALFWWDVYYPEQLQSLIVQMFGWNSPGAKYTRAIINQWLETEEELVSGRINQLFNLAKKSS